jgi:outer membrane protein assembly factor BamE (lipoprotein component of BamABCDE complex)
MAIRVVKP